jgi:hypothetical protein
MKWIGQHIWDFISRFRSDVYLESLTTTTETNVLVVDSAGKVSKSTSVAGDLTSVVAGTGLSGIDLTGPIPTLNVDASQTQITEVGTISVGAWRGTPLSTAYIADDAITEDKLDNTLLAEIDANTAKPDLTVSGAGTVHVDNYIENVVQTSVTGNAGTATALTSGSKVIAGDLSLTGSTNKLIINNTETVQVASGVVTIGQTNRVLNLSASTLIVPNIEIGALTDTTIQRVSPGVVSIEGNTIATTNKVIDTKVAAYHSGYLNTGYYITLSGASTSESTALSTSSYTSIFVVPYDGKVLRISSHSQSSTSKSSTLEMYINGDDSNLTTSQRGTDVSTGTYNRTFTVDCASDWTFSRGETIAIRRTDTDEVYGTSMTVVLEYDTTT